MTVTPRPNVETSWTRNGPIGTVDRARTNIPSHDPISPARIGARSRLVRTRSVRTLTTASGVEVIDAQGIELPKDPLALVHVVRVVRVHAHQDAAGSHRLVGELIRLVHVHGRIPADDASDGAPGHCASDGRGPH